PQSVAWIARSMGLNRQGVQRIVNELASESLLEFRTNPHHRRARLVVLMRKGKAAYAAIERAQIPWVNALSKGLRADDIHAVTALVGALRNRLEDDLEAGERDDEA
ncbi:MAG: MarR family transcriptional regulator, partial [Hyphomicrobium sp.]